MMIYLWQNATPATTMGVAVSNDRRRVERAWSVFAHLISTFAPAPTSELVSTHAHAKGATRPGELRLATWDVSTHAPAKGATRFF